MGGPTFGGWGLVYNRKTKVQQGLASAPPLRQSVPSCRAVRGVFLVLKMSKVRTIDTHTHVLTEETAALLRKEAPKVPVTITPIDDAMATLDVGGVAYRPYPRG
ncbi:MAG TPA: hypothetical protein VEJ43_08190, partial [Pseudolabrys sp.]|nr:hypothetical protein [Pseudolabrys sp.]